MRIARIYDNMNDPAGSRNHYKVRYFVSHSHLNHVGSLVNVSCLEIEQPRYGEIDV